MQRLFFILVFIFTAGHFSALPAQNAVEIQQPAISEDYLTLIEEASKLSGQNPEKELQFFEDSISHIAGHYERFNTSFFHLFIRYTRMGQIEKAMNVLLQGQKENFFYPISAEGRKFPPNVDEFTRLKDFAEFLKKNNQLREQAQKNAKFEYFVQLPKNYTKEKSYPLLLVLTGGWGSHLGLSESWHSSRLEADYISVYTQGSVCRGSFLRSYQRESMENIMQAYKQIIEKYAVDTARVIIGGQSAGGRRAFSILLDELIPVRGLIGAFPVIPKNLDSDKIKQAAERGVRVAIISGENDWGLKKQKAAAVLFDEQGLQNRFIIFPEKGHEFPDNFSRQIDLSLDFIFK